MTEAPDAPPPSEAAHLSLAQALTLLHSSEADDPLDHLLELVGTGMRVSRVYLFQFRDQGRVMDNTHEWCASGVEPQRDRLQDVPSDRFPWWMDRLGTGEGVAVSSLEELPEEAHAERDILEAQGIQAVLALPLATAGGELLGFMGFDEVKGRRDWTPRETESLRLICQLGTRELELRRAGEALRRMQDRLTRTETIAQVGGWEFDPGTGSTWWSDEAARILGAPPSRGTMTLFDFFQRLHPDDRDRARRTALSAMDEGRPFRFECRLLPGEAHPRHVEVHGEVLPRDDGPGVVVGTLQDITDRRRLEEHLGQAQRMEAVGKLAGGVAHDFNNLMSVILGNTELLLERYAGSGGSDGARGLHGAGTSDGPGSSSRLRSREDSDGPLEDLLQIRDAARQGAALTRKLLAFSRRQNLDPRSVELNEVLEGMQEMLRRLLPEELELDVALDAQVGTVQVDRGQLEQIVMNLAVNARDAMEPGGTLRIATSRMRLPRADVLEPGQTLEPGTYAVLSVADNGHGMPPEIRDRVFEPFFTTRDAGEATGMGLASVYGVARQSGGGITVESEEGVGTRFRVFLPMAESAATDAAHLEHLEPEPLEEEGPPDDADDGSTGRDEGPRDERSSEEAGTDQETSASETSQPAILLVEDDAAVARTARKALERAGYRVMVAHRPAEALRAIREDGGHIGLVITDVVLPDMRGFDLVRELRKERKDLRTVFISGYPLGMDPDGELAEPGAAFLPKPFSLSKLVRLVKESLQSAAIPGD